MGEVHRLPARQVSFSLQTAGRLMTRIFPQWVQDLALLIVVADARVVRIGRNASFGRVMLLNAADRRPIGMVAGAYAIL